MLINLLFLALTLTCLLSGNLRVCHHQTFLCSFILGKIMQQLTHFTAHLSHARKGLRQRRDPSGADREAGEQKIKCVYCKKNCIIFKPVQAG